MLSLSPARYLLITLPRHLAIINRAVVNLPFSRSSSLKAHLGPWNASLHHFIASIAVSADTRKLRELLLIVDASFAGTDEPVRQRRGAGTSDGFRLQCRGGAGDGETKDRRRASQQRASQLDGWVSERYPLPEDFPTDFPSTIE